MKTKLYKMPGKLNLTDVHVMSKENSEVSLVVVTDGATIGFNLEKGRAIKLIHDLRKVVYGYLQK
jgi:hypothetical protein